MDRAFLDANVLFSAAYDPRAGIADLWNLTQTELVTSPCAASEALRNIAAKCPNRLDDLDRLLRRVGLVVEPVANSLPIGIELPPKDHPILLAAIQCAASHLLTGDKHFRTYFGRVISGVFIIRPGDYLQLKRHLPSN